MTARVIAVCVSPRHGFSKAPQLSLRLVAGLGAEGDAHKGAAVKHRHQARKTPDAPNLRQVHLMHSELFGELQAQGFAVAPGDLGENITTCGVDLLGLPQGARLRLGDEAIVEVTGLRSPCVLIDRFQAGLKNALLGRDGEGRVLRKSGIMAIVIAGGEVRAGDALVVETPAGDPKPLEPV